MKENPYDRVVTKTQKRIESVSDRIARNFKGTNPFDKEPVSTTDMLTSYEMLLPEDIQYLISEHGRDKVNDFIGEMETLRTKHYE